MRGEYLGSTAERFKLVVPGSSWVLRNKTHTGKGNMPGTKVVVVAVWPVPSGTQDYRVIYRYEDAESRQARDKERNGAVSSFLAAFRRVDEQPKTTIPKAPYNDRLIAIEEEIKAMAVALGHEIRFIKERP